LIWWNIQTPPHRVYRLFPAEDTELKMQLEAYLQSGQIEPARSPFGAGVLFARKKDGNLRFCIDYRALNTITVKDKYPLPRIDELLDNIAGTEYFTKMDLQQGYHKIRVKPKHVQRTAFQTKFVSFQCRVMPFGLCNAPSTFQRTMNNILADCSGFADVYIDDIVIYLRTLDDHLTHLRAVLLHLRADKLFAKLNKCSFGRVLWISRESRRDQISPRQGYGHRKLAHPTHCERCKEFSGPGTLLPTFCQEFCGHGSYHSANSLLKKIAQWSWQVEALPHGPQGACVH